MNDPDSDISEEVMVFRARFLPAFLLITLPAGIIAFGLLLHTEGTAVKLVGLGIAALVLIYGGARWARYFIKNYPVAVSPSALRVYGLRGGIGYDQHWLEWPAITRAWPFYLPFFTCLVVRTNFDKRRYWIPLRLVDALRFRDLVNGYVGRAHPVTRVLYRHIS